VGRLDDISHSGMDWSQIVEIFGNTIMRPRSSSRACGTRSTSVDAALAGAHVATIPYGVIDQL